MRRNARTNKWLDAQVQFLLGSLSFDWSVTQWKVIRRTLNRVRKGALRVPKAERKEGRLQPTDAIGLNATVSLSSLQVGVNSLDPNDDQRLRLILMGFEANLQKRQSETRPGFKKQVVNLRLDSCTLEQPKLKQVLFSQKLPQGLLDFTFDMNYRKLPDLKHEFEDMLFNLTFNGSRVFFNLERWDHIQEKLKENFEKVKDKAKEKAKEKKAAVAESDKPLGVIGGIVKEVQDLLKENAVLLLESKEKRHEFVEDLKQRLREKKAGSSKAEFLRKLKYQIIFSDNELAIQPKDHEHQLVFSLNKMFLLNDVTWKQSIPLLEDARRELIEERAFQESPLPVARAEEDAPPPVLPHRGSKPPPPVPDKPSAGGPPPRPTRPDAPASAAGAPPPRPAKPGQPANPLANPLAVDAGSAPSLPARVYPHNLQVVVHGFGISLVGEDNSSSALLTPLDFELYARYRGHDTESASLELAWHSEKFEASINHYHTAERTFEHVKKWLKHRQEKVKAKVAGPPPAEGEAAPTTGEKAAEKVSAAKNKLDDLLGKVDLKTDDLKAAKGQVHPSELVHKVQDHLSDFLKHHRGCVLIQFEQVIFNIAEDKEKPAINPLDTKQGRPHKQVLNRVSLLASSTAEQQDAVFAFAVSDMEFVNHPTFPLYVSAVPLNTALYGLPLSPNIVVHYKHNPQTAPLLLFQFSGIKITALARVAPGQDTLAKISAPEIVHFLKNFKEILTNKASGYKEKLESFKGKFEELKDKASSLKSRVSDTVSSVTGVDAEQAASGGLTEENVSRVMDAAERFFKTAYPYLPQIQFDTGDCHFEFQFEVPHFGTETKPISLRFVDPKRGAINRRMTNVGEMENRLRQSEKEKGEMQQTMSLLETQLITHQKMVFDLQSENEQLRQQLDQLQRRVK